MGTLPNNRSRRGRSEGSIYQRKTDGLWVGCVSLGVHQGRRDRRTVYGKTKAEAAAKLRELQVRNDAGRLSDAGNITVEEWLERWLSFIAPTIEPGTLSPYTRHARKHIVPRIGGYKIQRLRPADVESLYSRLLKDGLSASLVRKIGTTLSIAMNHAVRSQLIPSNPTRGIRRPKAAKSLVKVYTTEQAAALVAACRTERMGPLFILILDAGLRPGEALALTWKDIDFTGSRVSITKTLEDTGRVKAPKTAKSIRTIDLTEGTVAALHAHRKAMLAEGKNVRSGPCFVTATGAHILPNDITRGHLRPILEKAKLPPLTAYGLRHTCATILLGATPPVHPKVVSERLGHGSITMTMDTYSHVLPGMGKTATDAMSKALGGSR